MNLDPRFDISHEPDLGDPDKPFIGRFRGAWVVSAGSEQSARQLLFRFHNRRVNPKVHPIPAYMVRTADGSGFYPSGDLDECRRTADSLGEGSDVVPLVETGSEVIEPRGDVVYQAGGSSKEDVPSHDAVWWTRVAPDTLRLGDFVELPPTQTRPAAVVVQITGYTGRQFPGRSPEFELANVLGEPVGSTDLSLDAEAVLVLDQVWEQARRLNDLWQAGSILAGEGLLSATDFDRVRDRVQGKRQD